jgi:hypothetical protein
MEFATGLANVLIGVIVRGALTRNVQYTIEHFRHTEPGVRRVSAYSL